MSLLRAKSVSKSFRFDIWPFFGRLILHLAEDLLVIPVLVVPIVLRLVPVLLRYVCRQAAGARQLGYGAANRASHLCSGVVTRNDESSTAGIILNH